MTNNHINNQLSEFYSDIEISKILELIIFHSNICNAKKDLML